MREFLLNSESMLDPDQIAYINESGQTLLLPCSRIRFNDRVKLAFFPDGCGAAGAVLPERSLDEVCEAAKSLLDAVMQLERIPEITPENIVWDVDDVYLEEETGAVRLLYMPVRAAEDVRSSRIYVRRVYAVIEELLERVSGGDTMIRQIEFQKQQAIGDWAQLQEALDKRVPTQSETIGLKGLDAMEGRRYQAGHADFRIGSNTELTDATIDDELVDPLHAVIGWNEISFYIMDLGSRNGTFVNGTQIAPNTQIPIGPGSVIRVASYAFEVE